MRKFDFQIETYILEANLEIEYYTCLKHANWAIKAIENGLESENLFIIAGFYDEQIEIINKYLDLVKEEFHLDKDSTSSIKFHVYAKYIMKEVVNKSIDPDKGLSILIKIYEYLDFDERYLNFENLKYDLDNLGKRGYFTYNTIRSLEDEKKYIIEECRLFLLYDEIENKQELKEQVYCAKCHHIGNPSLKNKGFFFQRSEINCCSQCRSTNTYPFSDQVGRAKIIEREISRKKLPNRKNTK